MTVAADLAIELPDALLHGALEVPETAAGIVLFAHGSGSSRTSPRNAQVARTLREAGLGTLLFDLLTEAEERLDAHSRRYRFDVSLLAERLAAVTEWLRAREPQRSLGYFGASTGAAAALVAAAAAPLTVNAIVSRGGRPDLAGDALRRVRAPTLLIVGSRDTQVLELNRHALAALRCEKALVVVPGATHLFEEPGTLEQVAEHAANWFADRLVALRPGSDRQRPEL